MIYYIDCKDKEKIGKALGLCSDSADICSCRISCLIKSYGDYDGFISLWIQYNENNFPTAVIIKYGGDVTVSLGENANFDEIREFIALVGMSSVLSMKKMFGGSESGVIMKSGDRIFGDCCNNNPNVVFSPELSSVHKLLRVCGSNSFECPPYEEFILDTSHKLRHDCAYCCAVMSGNEVISYAMTVAVTDESAIIGAVCTHPELRKRGYGSLCVSSLISRLGNREVFIMRAWEENEGFYRKLGFENCGEFYIYRPSNLLGERENGK